MNFFKKNWRAVYYGVLVVWALVGFSYAVATQELRSFTFFPEEAAIAEPEPLLKNVDFEKWAEADLAWKRSATEAVLRVEALCTPKKAKR